MQGTISEYMRELMEGRIEHRHLIIAAKLGHDEALERVKKGFMNGVVGKEDFEAALRGHQFAVDATKSEQRDAAYAFFKQYGSF